MDAEPSDAPAAPGAPAPGPKTEEEWSVRYKYLLADFENFRRRTERERDAVARQTRADLLRELIPLYESFQHARKAAAGTNRSIAEGLDLLDLEWQRFLAREGVRAVAVVGEPFAPEEEEAVAESAADGEHLDGCIVEIVQQGYRFPGGLLRPAKIVVARANPETISPGGPVETTGAGASAEETDSDGSRESPP